MWNKSSSNKHLQKLSKQQAYRKHIITLYEMRSTIDNKPPKQYDFLKRKPKAQTKKRQRQDQIQKNNNILVDRMVRNGSDLTKGYKSTYVKDSLNAKVMKKRERQIDIQNQRLVKKIQSVNSQYSKAKLQKDADKYERLKSSLAYSRMHQAYDLIGDRQQQSHNLTKRSTRRQSAKI